MTRLTAILFLFWGLALSADVLEVGDEVPDMCWADAESQEVCLKGFPVGVKVLLYNTGWCPDCIKEMEELVPKVGEFLGVPVQFLSLSASGFSPSKPPDAEFLKAWKEKFNIPFPVLASPKDPGKKFFEPPYYIPAVVIIDKENRVFFKAVEPETEVILEKAREALAAWPNR